MMRNLKMASIFFLATTLFSHAQDLALKLGKVPVPDLKMEVYPQDSTADAVILGDLREVYFIDLYNVKIKQTLRIKILTADGLDWGTYAIPLLTSSRVTAKGFVTNLENGSVEIVKLRKEHQSVEKVTDVLGRTTVTFPDVKVGSVLDLEYSYTIDLSDFVYRSREFSFQRSIPIREQVLELNLPDFLKFDFRQQGFETVTGFVKGNMSRMLDVDGGRLPVNVEQRVFYSRNMPALKSEPYINNLDNYRTSVSMEIYMIQFSGGKPTVFSKNWPDIERELMESVRFGKIIEGNAQTKELASSITEGITDPQEMINAVGAYMKSNYEWNGNYGVYGDHELRKLLKEKEGDASNLNMLAVNLLREAGLSAFPVILSTRGHGVINPFFPLLTDYNYALAYVKLDENKGVFLDVTNPDLPLDMIPFRCLNGNGRLLFGGGGDWIDVQCGKINRQTMKGAFTLAEDGTLMGNVRLATQGYQSLQVAEMVAEEGEEVRDQDFKGDHTEWQFSNYALDNRVTEGGPLNESWEAETYEVAMATGDRIYLNALLGYGLTENPFRVENRRFPVDRGVGSDQTTMLQIQLPEGYEVEEVPENAMFAMPNRAGIYRLTYQLSENQITVISKLSLPQSQYLVEEYPSLREFVNMVIAKNEGQIVLKKKAE